MNRFFEKLDEEIKKYKNIIIIGHKNPDLDCIASSCALYKIIKDNCYVYKTTEELTNSAYKAYEELEKEKIRYINKNNYKEYIEKALLIVVDLHKKTLIENEKLLDEIKDKIIIDHHIIGKNKISANLEYIDDQASSTVEIIIEYMKYKNTKINENIATIMLAGIEIDTNGYNMKTTEKTFQAATYLMQKGANNILKQKLLKEPKENYVERTNHIEKSFIIDNMIICTLNKKIYNPIYLATLAEDLLRFEGVEASFAIGRINKDVVGISSRSLGNIDVEKYMRKLGGGGHKTDAACQIQEKKPKKVEKNLIKKLGK